MAGFLYFKPNVEKPVTLEDVRAWGLGHAFTDKVACCRCIGNSPSGGGGQTFGDRSRLGGREARMDLEAQTWARIAPGDVWVGYWNDVPPTPEELARPQQIPGYNVPLAGDRKWVVPLVRRFDAEATKLVTALPTYMRLDDEGNWTEGAVVEAHAHLWSAVEPFAEETWKSNDPANEDYEPHDFTVAELAAVVTTLLQANYVVGPGELSVLKAFTSDQQLRVAVMLACDIPTLLSWLESQKKTACPSPVDGSTTSDGATG